MNQKIRILMLLALITGISNLEASFKKDLEILEVFGDTLKKAKPLSVEKKINVTHFGPFSFNHLNEESLKPVEFVSFKGKSQQDKVILSWTTASEVNNDHFTLERSENGVDFVKVKKIKGAGNSNAIQTYSIIDEDPPIGTSYYRVKQTCSDQSFSHSFTVQVVLGR